MIAYPDSNERTHCARVGLALLLLAAFVPGILGEPVAGHSSRQRSLAIPPSVVSSERLDNRSVNQRFRAARVSKRYTGHNTSFEEDRRPLTPARYAWRNFGFAASFQAGGTVWFTREEGPQARLTFPGAALTAEPRGEGASVQKALYYVGPAENWRSASHFERVRYPHIYPGIDLVFIANSGQLEYNFEVSPHADPSVIRMHYENARAGLDGEGNLRVDFAGTTILQRRPRAFQRDGMRRRAIACRYRLEETGDVTLGMASYDRNSPLIVDPVLIFS